MARETIWAERRRKANARAQEDRAGAAMIGRRQHNLVRLKQRQALGEFGAGEKAKIARQQRVRRARKSRPHMRERVGAPLSRAARLQAARLRLRAGDGGKRVGVASQAA